jgi:hypothetical protein
MNRSTLYGLVALLGLVVVSWVMVRSEPCLATGSFWKQITGPKECVRAVDDARRASAYSAEVGGLLRVRDEINAQGQTRMGDDFSHLAGSSHIVRRLNRPPRPRENDSYAGERAAMARLAPPQWLRSQAP